MGDASILWRTHSRVALTLWISMPSPERTIVILRNSLPDLLALENVAWCVGPVLQVVPLCDFFLFFPIRTIYVGSGCVSFDLKPSV